MPQNPLKHCLRIFLAWSGFCFAAWISARAKLVAKNP